MKLNAGKTNTMIVFRSSTKHPKSPPLTIIGTVLKDVDDIHILGVTLDKLLDHVVSDVCFLLKTCLSVTFTHRGSVVVYVCCIRSLVTRCTLFMALNLYSMCQGGLHAVLWSYIGILMRLLAAELRSTA